MKISYIYGACVKHDAISNSIRDEIAGLVANGIKDIRLYAHECQHEALPFFRATSLTDIALDSHFQSSNLAVFHFGIYYDFFNLLPIVPNKTKRVVVFHNITPREFVAGANHALIDRSFAQMENIAWANHVICDSQTNLEVLRSLGIGVPASVLPLGVRTYTPPPLKPSFGDGLPRIVFVGRFVRSKGVLDLLAALRRAVDLGMRIPLRLDMVGNLFYSDPQLVAEIKGVAKQLERKCGRQLEVQIHGNASEERKQQLLREADVFVLPTYHEGFCVPIVEALASGCKVVAYANSNTPAISGGFATLTPTGDIERLASAIQQSVETIRSPQWRGTGITSYTEHSNRAHCYARQFAPEHVGRRFAELIRELTGPTRDLSKTHTVKPKPRKSLRICIATSYTRSFAKCGDLSAATLRMYASRHQCQARILPTLETFIRPPAWHRILWIPQLFEEGFDFVFWIDADALFLRFDADLRELIGEGKDLYMVRHYRPDHWGETRVPNTGVMLVRNCSWSSDLFCSLWNCERYVNHPWFENAALISLFGYHSLLLEGPDDPNMRLLEHVSFIGTEWNSIPNVCPAGHPIIQHYAGQQLETREAGMMNDFEQALRNVKQNRTGARHSLFGRIALRLASEK